MTWLLRILVSLGIILALVIAIVLVIGNLGTRDDTTQAISMTVGSRTITVAGHFNDLAQEYTSNGIKLVVGGHEVTISDDQLSVDGKVEVIEPDQDIMVYVGKDGKITVSLVEEGEGASEEAPG